jgi:serine/threonine protein phosphatase PrpC
MRERENRIVTDDIPGKLARELAFAREQMDAELENLPFRYVEAPHLLDWDHRSGRGIIGEYEVGFCHAKGRRPSMEDEHLAIFFNLQLQGSLFPVYLFAIFDGHCGSLVAKFVKNHLKDQLVETLGEFNSRGLSDEGIWNALKIACVRLNKKIPWYLGAQGSTGTIAMILDGKLWVANVGDSRTVLDNNGDPIPLSDDATLSKARFIKGILKRRGAILYRRDEPNIPRLNGVLSVARAFGDCELGSAVSARPKNTAMPLSGISINSHLVLACDGIYDVSTTRKIVKAVHGHSRRSPMLLAEDLVYSSLVAGSTDNLSVLIVRPRPQF